MRRKPAIDRFQNEGASARAAADHIAAGLGDALAARGAASFVATGGRTPAPVYVVLRDARLDWSRVSVTLSDERWVDESSADSNARLVRQTLLTGAAGAATLVPLKTADARPEEAAPAVEARLRAMSLPFDVVMLGMGDDGHVASLFRRNPCLGSAMRADSDRLCVAMGVGPEGLPPAQARMSLTLAALNAARQVMIYITGETKWAVLQKALAGDDVMEMPVRAILTGPSIVRVIWSPGPAI